MSAGLLEMAVMMRVWLSVGLPELIPFSERLLMEAFWENTRLLSGLSVGVAFAPAGTT